CQKYINSPFTF
nr:immunoglobulin light chain junction region [Macaca mulatta]MOW08476.1 immunoglobulin light chain junction region [Macaca mulatta]MOW08897.1 immunoglobulin light chain junction region [Macaca mulatta]MOW09366.1 immunoglobulin light chain junction region [Macaca mulatta]MOW09872.1 immunoglobulin light chain junction region [Macaca mulatta]